MARRLVGSNGQLSLSSLLLDAADDNDRNGVQQDATDDTDDPPEPNQVDHIVSIVTVASLDSRVALIVEVVVVVPWFTELKFASARLTHAIKRSFMIS